MQWSRGCHYSGVRWYSGWTGQFQGGHKVCWKGGTGTVSVSLGGFHYQETKPGPLQIIMLQEGDTGPAFGTIKGFRCCLIRHQRHCLAMCLSRLKPQ